MSGSRSRKRSSARNNSNSNSFSASLSRSKSICGRCGQQHRYKCPAIGKTCAVCKKPNHIAKLCFLNKKTGDRDVRLSNFQMILTVNKKILTKENLIMINLLKLHMNLKKMILSFSRKILKMSVGKKVQLCQKLISLGHI